MIWVIMSCCWTPIYLRGFCVNIKQGNTLLIFKIPSEQTSYTIWLFTQKQILQTLCCWKFINFKFCVSLSFLNSWEYWMWSECFYSIGEIEFIILNGWKYGALQYAKNKHCTTYTKWQAVSITIPFTGTHTAEWR